jgi:DNA helicase II / ATP-dependent DNA helicase PcrA
MDRKSLSARQKDAPNIVTTRHTRVEVSACPGSGKTYTLIERLKHLLTDRKIPPEAIAVLSFSNATKDELLRRLQFEQTETQIDFSGVEVKTVHSYALSLTRERGEAEAQTETRLRKNSKRLKGFKSSVKRGKLISDKQRFALLEKATRQVANECASGKRWSSLSVSQRKNRENKLFALADDRSMQKLLIAALCFKSATLERFTVVVARDQFRPLERFVKVLAAVRNSYSRLKQRQSIVDYDDMLLNARQLVADTPRVIKHKHFLVDEFQDSSFAQIALIASLAKLEGRTAMVFGDPFQSIYGFMGASYSPLREQLSKVETLFLPKSKRLTKEVAALASAMMGATKGQRIATDKSGAKPRLLEWKSTETQANAIAVEVGRLIKARVPASKIAILARTKTLLTEIEAALLARDVNTMRLNDTRRITDVLSVLNLVRVVEHHADASERIGVKSAKRVVPTSMRADVSATAIKKLCSSLERAKRMSSLGGRYAECVKAYLRLWGGARANRGMQHDLNRWQPICGKYRKSSAMRRELRLMADEAAVVTGTIHAAKGREWTHVYVVGVTEGVLPIRFAQDDDSIAQELNLIYVASTRAIDTLTLCHAPVSVPGKRKQFKNRSRFISSRSVSRHLTIKSSG